MKKEKNENLGSARFLKEDLAKHGYETGNLVTGYDIRNGVLGAEKNSKILDDRTDKLKQEGYLVEKKRYSSGKAKGIGTVSEEQRQLIGEAILRALVDRRKTVMEIADHFILSCDCGHVTSLLEQLQMHGLPKNPIFPIWQMFRLIRKHLGSGDLKILECSECGGLLMNQQYFWVFDSKDYNQ